jgi:hypothetical protein
LATAAIAATNGRLADAAPDAERPNILVFIADDPAVPCLPTEPRVAGALNANDSH